MRRLDGLITAAGSTLIILGMLGSTPGCGSGNCVEEGLPDGSYEETCRECVVCDEKTLKCECQAMNGDWSATSLDLQSCNGTVANLDATLTCQASGDDDDDDTWYWGDDDTWYW